jgi:hypothetical protein
MKNRATWTMILAGLLTVSGCATYDSSVPAATGIGAAGGALIGYGMTGSGTGAAIGAGAGALAGALTGVAIDESRRASEPPPQSYPAPAPRAYAPQGDPTQGIFLNHTGWRLEVWVDNASQPLHMQAGESYAIDLDVGVHDVFVRAYVATRSGERLAGTYQRSINVDPRGSGFSLRFEERMFR